MSALKSKLKTKQKHLKLQRSNIDTTKKVKKTNKIIEEIEADIMNPEKLGGDVFITYTYFQENAYNSMINFKMDFYHKEKRIYVVAAKGEDDSMMIIPISRNCVRLDDFKNKVYKNIDEKSYIVLYKADQFGNIAKSHNKRLLRRTTIEESRIMRFENNISEWLNKFHGIATKYLESYMRYFILYNLDRSFNALAVIRYLFSRIDFIKSHKIKNIKLCV